MRHLRPEEEWARQSIANALGQPVVQHDDGSAPGMHDLEILYTSGVAAAVEVTAAVDSQATVLWNLMNGGGRWIEADLTGGWMATLLPTARAKRIRAELPAMLRRLEAAEIHAAHARHPRDDHRLPEELADLRVVSVRQSATAYPGSIYITLDLPAERSGGFVNDTGNALAKWLSAFLAGDERRDLRQKLGRSAAQERHAVVILAGFADADFPVTDVLMRDDAPLPVEAPDLPAEVTHVWALSTWSSARGMRWSTETGWLTFTKTAPTDMPPS